MTQTEIIKCRPYFIVSAPDPLGLRHIAKHCKKSRASLNCEIVLGHR